MAKTNIKFNNTNFLIDDSSLATATAELQSHLSTVMNGSGATINLGGVSYNIDSAKLSNATNDFVSHLGTISGSGSNVVVNGVTYNVDSTKTSGAISGLETTFSQFVERLVDENWVVGESVSPSAGANAARFKNMGYFSDRKRLLHENSVIEVVVDGVTIICPLDGVPTGTSAYTTIGLYHGFEIKIGSWRINSQTGLYTSTVQIPYNTTSVTYKYPSVDETIEATE